MKHWVRVADDVLSHRIQLFQSLLDNWAKRINLIAASDAQSIYSRHISDSLQLIDYIPSRTKNALDIGSGAGFPGLMIAAATNLTVTLVESDRRKGAFLSEAARLMGLQPMIYMCRVEQIPAASFDLVTARGVGALRKIIPILAPFLRPGGVALLPRGTSLGAELTTLKGEWHIKSERLTSQTHPNATILKILELSRLTHDRPRS